MVPWAIGVSYWVTLYQLARDLCQKLSLQHPRMGLKFWSELVSPLKSAMVEVESVNRIYVCSPTPAADLLSVCWHWLAGSGLWLGSYRGLLAISTGSKPQDQSFHRTPGSHTLHIVWAEAVLRIQGGAESSVCCSHEGLCLCCRAANRPLWIFTVPRECPY